MPTIQPAVLSDNSPEHREFSASSFPDSVIDEINAYFDEVDALRAADELSVEAEERHYAAWLASVA